MPYLRAPATLLGGLTPRNGSDLVAQLPARALTPRESASRLDTFSEWPTSCLLALAHATRRLCGGVTSRYTWNGRLYEAPRRGSVADVQNAHAEETSRSPLSNISKAVSHPEHDTGTH
ncbi:unnamed protein product [Peniophora sp. CBMAI 1063]|nr:unnamed protein product [Peniophora sp. CBMAI 1063]